MYNPPPPPPSLSPFLPLALYMCTGWACRSVDRSLCVCMCVYMYMSSVPAGVLFSVRVTVCTCACDAWVLMACMHNYHSMQYSVQYMCVKRYECKYMYMYMYTMEESCISMHLYACTCCTCTRKNTNHACTCTRTLLHVVYNYGHTCTCRTTGPVYSTLAPSLASSPPLLPPRPTRCVPPSSSSTR